MEVDDKAQGSLEICRAMVQLCIDIAIREKLIQRTSRLLSSRLYYCGFGPSLQPIC